MERLTWECELDGFTDIGLRDGVTVDVAICRLSAYERTGLEPEEILRILDAYGRRMSLRAESAQRLESVKDIQTDRLQELAQADQDGRCVVLPCKKSDVVWRIVHDAIPHITKDQCTDITLVGGDVWVRLIGDMKMGAWNFGRLLFATREEAEAALRREQDE